MTTTDLSYRRVEFRMNDELHQKLRASLSAGGEVRKTFPKDFLGALLNPYLIYYLNHPEIMEQLIVANMEEVKVQITEL